MRGACTAESLVVLYIAVMLHYGMHQSLQTRDTDRGPGRTHYGRWLHVGRNCMRMGEVLRSQYTRGKGVVELCVASKHDGLQTVVCTAEGVATIVCKQLMSGVEELGWRFVGSSI